MVEVGPLSFFFPLLLLLVRMLVGRGVARVDLVSWLPWRETKKTPPTPPPPPAAVVGVGLPHQGPRGIPVIPTGPLRAARGFRTDRTGASGRVCPRSSGGDTADGGRALTDWVTCPRKIASMPTALSSLGG
jgi:hypothetical protein